MKTIGIIGGGVSGLATAIQLSKLNNRIVLLEKHPLPYKPKNNFLTFNFTINYRGLKSLQELGLWDEVKSLSTPLYSRVVHSEKGGKVQKYSPDGEFVLYSIPRIDLLNILYGYAKSISNIDILEGCLVTNIQTERPVSIDYLKQNKKSREEVDFIVAADGANSPIRTMFRDRLKPSLKDFKWGYIEITISKSEPLLVQPISTKSLHVWSGKNFICVGIPNKDETVSLLYLSSFRQEEGQSEVTRFLNHAKHHIACSVGKIEALSTLDRCSKIGRIRMVSCANWYIDNAILLVGDAAHAFCPFYGQGMNASLQDACTLRDLLDFFPINQVFGKFYDIRKPSMDILSELSNKHFYRLKDKFHSSFYNASYKLDYDLCKKYPKLWMHEYTKLSNSCDAVEKIHSRIKKQKLLKLNPIYAFMYLIYLLKEISERICELARPTRGHSIKKKLLRTDQVSTHSPP